MLFEILNKVVINFTTNKENISLVILKKSTRRYYENKDERSNQQKLYSEKNRDVLLAKSKIDQQNRKTHTQQIKDLNNKLIEITLAMEMYIFKKWIGLLQ